MTTATAAVSTIHDLVASVRAVEADSAITDTVPKSILADDGSYSQSDLHPKVQEVVRLACEVLIDEDGHIRHDLLRELRGRHDIGVSRGDHDSFGWLTGVVHTSKGIVLFG